MSQPQPQTQTDLLPRSADEKLHEHAATISTFIHAQYKAGAEMYGYAFLAGHRMLLAKDDVPHGNSGDRTAGLCKWAEANVQPLRDKRIEYRTLTRWMELARGVQDHFAARQYKKLPLLLSRRKLKKGDLPVILEAVLKIMDGKSMLSFMRDSRLLRDPEKAAHHPRGAADPEKELLATKKRAARHWKTVAGDLSLGLPIIKHLPPDQCAHAAFSCLAAAKSLIATLEPKLQSEHLGYLIDLANTIRTRIQKQK